MASTSYQIDSSCFPFSSSTPRWNHDVFLSFRGSDTRKNFIGHLYSALKEAGIRTFIDEDELQRGEEIWSELLKAIQESKISIVVFSKNYASSRWCLDELVKILECKTTMGRLVYPVFYYVDPSHVRHQTGSFAEAFKIHKERFVADMVKVEKWRAALTEAANLSGYDLLNDANGHESKFIQKIVEKVLLEVNPICLNVSEHPVGIDCRVKDINPLMSIGSNEVRLIGIYGMGGVGKTTIAKAVYNNIFHHFEGSCFVANVREVSEQPNGLVHLQEQIIFEILKKKNLKVGQVDRGIGLLKERLLSRRVLIVLDDLDKLSQVKSLAARHWFGSGSRIIITTRDEHLLNQVQVDVKYKVEELDYYESLELLSWHAFKNVIPSADFMELLEGIVNYAGGLPLALEVLGSYLFERTIVEWRSALEKLQRIPHNQIQKKLRISFDALDDDDVRDIFLDIACFFIGMAKDYAVNILNSSGFFSEIGISILIERCLLTINNRNELRMHDLIRDMGREIVREESPKEPGKCSRIWLQEDACDVLIKQKGTEAIEGVLLDLSTSKQIHFDTKTFRRMHRLRLLQINNVHLTGSFEHLFEELRWLCWHYCPLKYLPSDFHPKKLVTLDISCSNVKRVWQGVKFLENLKVLNLSNSKFLTTTPDFTHVPRLEKLLLEGCTSLLEVHPSIGLMGRLVYLVLKNCKSLRNLPSNICNLRSLEYLDLDACSSMEQLPEKIGHMECLKKLYASGTVFKQLPDSFRLLKKLTLLSLVRSNKNTQAKYWHSFLSSRMLPRSPNTIKFLPPSISGLWSLRDLNISYCNLLDRDIPDDLGSLVSLVILLLSGNNFCSIPSSLSQLSNLQMLSLTDCMRLQSLPELPPNLQDLGLDGCRSFQSLPELPNSLKLRWLDARDCTSLEKLPNLSNLKHLELLDLGNCSKLAEIQGLENLNSVRAIKMECCCKLATAFKDSSFQRYMKVGNNFDIVLPRREIPDWLRHQGMGSSISFDMPLNMDNRLVGITIYAGYATKEGTGITKYSLGAYISNGTERVELNEWYSNCPTPITLEDHLWVSHIPKHRFRLPLRGGDKIEIAIIGHENVEVNKCGVHLVYKPDIHDADVREFSCPNTDIGRDDSTEGVHMKRERDVDLVETSNELSNKDKDSKKLRLELI